MFRRAVLSLHDARRRGIARSLCRTWRHAITWSLLDVASLGLSARQRGVTQYLCSAFDQSTSRSLADVKCHHFPRHNTLSNISDQVIYIHDVEGETGRSIADRPRTLIRVIAGTNAGGRSIGVAVSAKCQTVVSSATHGAAFHAVFAVL